MKLKLSSDAGSALSISLDFEQPRGSKPGRLIYRARRAIERLRADLGYSTRIRQREREMQRQLFDDAVDRLPFEERLRIARFR